MFRNGVAGIRCAETVRTLEGDPFAPTSCAAGVACPSEIESVGAPPFGEPAPELSPPAVMASEAVRSPSGRGVR
jgi:hypothetical protein